MNRFQFRLRTIFVATAVICLIAGAIAWMNHCLDMAFEAMVEGDNGLVTSVADWPRPLGELMDRATKENVKVGNLDIFCIADGLITEYVWRMESTPGMFDLIKKEFELYVDNAPRGSMSFTGSPDWWDIADDTSLEYFAGRSSNIGDKGDKFRVHHDEKRKLIYVYYNDNW